MASVHPAPALLARLLMRTAPHIAAPSSRLAPLPLPAVILNSNLNMVLPNLWLWDMVDEFVYQFQSFAQYRCAAGAAAAAACVECCRRQRCYGLLLRVLAHTWRIIPCCLRW